MELVNNIRSHKKLVVISSILIVIAVVAIIIMVNSIRVALIAEQNLIAFIHASNATIEYIEKTKGQWPSSWEDLHAIDPENKWIEQHVQFDFTADPDEIVQQTPKTFKAIKPNEPYYPVDDEIRGIIDTLKKYRDPNHNQKIE